MVSGNAKMSRRTPHVESEEVPRGLEEEEQMETGGRVGQKASGGREGSDGTSDLDIEFFSSPVATSSIFGGLSSNEEGDEEEREEVDSDASVECAQHLVSGAEDSNIFSSGKG